MSRMDAAGGLAVTTTIPILEPIDELMAANAPSRLVETDPSLWGDAAREEASIRLGWVDTHERSRALLPTLEAVTTQLREDGLTRVVLAGMGGSSLAPEVICATLDKPLLVLDTTDPDRVSRALGDDLTSTVVVVSSKSGSTIETERLRRAFVQAFTDAGIKNVGRHFVIVTDPGSPLEQLGKAMSATVIRADPNVGGRYSALTAFGLVPAALTGVDITELLDEADAFAPSLAAAAPDNPALALGAAIAGYDTMTIAPDGSGIIGLGDWIEQLIAESTGKDGKGVLPVVVESRLAPGSDINNALTCVVGGSSTGLSHYGGAQLDPPGLAVNGPLGAQFLCWEAACAFASHLIGIDPFNQPNVAESKENTSRILSAGHNESTPSFVQDAVSVYGSSATTVADALRNLVAATSDENYIAVMAYLDQESDAPIALLRQQLASFAHVPVTFGWGPRFLHSTGQFHKGGRQTGLFIQITADTHTNCEVPGRPFSFGDLIQAQAAGDEDALVSRGRPFIRFHLSDRAAGITQLLAASKEIIRP